MRKYIYVTMFLCLASVLGAATIFDQNFDAEPTDSVPANWNVINSNWGSWLIDDVIFCGPSGKSARLTQSITGGTLWALRWVDPLSSNIVFEFDGRASQTNGRSKAYLTDSTSSGVPCFVGFHDNGNIVYHTDGIGPGTAHDIQPYTAGTWYHFKFTNFNFVDSTYDIYIDSVLKVTSAKFFTYASYVATVNFQGRAEESGKIFNYDNVLLSTDTTGGIAEIVGTRHTLTFLVSPTPASKFVQLHYYLPTAQLVNLKIYSISGELLFSYGKAPEEAGTHTVNWDASHLQSGIYFAKLSTKSCHETRKILLVK